jgi:signal transduction histidine kinase
MELYQAIFASIANRTETQSNLSDLEMRLFGGKSITSPKPSFDLSVGYQGDEVVELVRESISIHQPFSIAFLDVRMPPGPTGIWAAEQIRALDSSIEIVFVTAFSDLQPEEIIRRVPPPHKLHYLRKPFHAEEIQQFALSLSAKWRNEKQLKNILSNLESLVEERTRKVSVTNAELERELAERKRLEQEKKRLEQQLYHSQKLEAIGRLAGGVAHAFNNLLTGIIGNINILSTRIPDECQKYLNNAKSATDRAAQLVQQLLMFSRKSDFELEPVELNRVIGDMYTTIRPRIDSRIGIEIETQNDSLLIKGNVKQIRSVLADLCNNARDAIEEVMKKETAVEPPASRFLITIRTGKVEVTHDDCSRNANARPGHFILLQVSDNGIGMSAEIRQKIFEPFFTTKDVGKGAGLGLAGVHGIVQQHHGWIEVQSEIGKGSTFRLYFPAAES